MKKIIKMIAVVALMSLTQAFAADIPVSNTQLDVTGNDVNINFSIAGNASTPDVKILFCDCEYGMDEITPIQPFMKWFTSSTDGITNIKNMVVDGWKISQIYSTHATNRQFYIVFIK